MSESESKQQQGAAMPARQLSSCGEVSCELLVNPIPRPKPVPIQIVIKPREPRVTLLAHEKPNSVEIFRLAQSILRERGIEVRAEILIKDNPGVPMSAAMLASLANEPGIVLCGISD